MDKVKGNISFESFMELRNSTEWFPWGALERAAKKSGCVFHDEAIRKAVLMDNPQKKPTSVFSLLSQLTGGSQLNVRTPNLPGRLQGRVLLLTVRSLLLQGKKFWRFLASLSAANGRHFRTALVFLVSLWSRWLDGGGSLLQVHCLLPTPPTCVTGTSRVPFLLLGVCWGSSTSMRSGQDAAERLLGTGRPSGSLGVQCHVRGFQLPSCRFVCCQRKCNLSLYVSSSGSHVEASMLFNISGMISVPIWFPFSLF